MSGTALFGFADQGWAVRGYHPWNAYCGRALAPGTTGARAAVLPTPPRPQPGLVGPLAGLPDPDEAPIVTACRRRLHEVHRLAEQLDRLRLDDRFDEVRDTLAPELHHELADAIEVLVYVRDALPADRSSRDCARGRSRQRPLQ